jgi:hypothetical protein
MSLREQMVRRANNPEGASAADFAAAIERDAMQVQPHIAALESRKRLFRAKAPHLRLRFFANQSHRDTWLAVALSEAHRKASEPAPVTIDRAQFKRVGELVINEATVVTPCSSSTHDPRYQLDPTEPLPPGLSSLPYGQYSAPASPWAVAAAQARQSAT